MVWCSHLFKNFPQFVVTHTVKGFSIVNEAEVSLEFLCFPMIQQMLAIQSLVPLPCTFGSFQLYTYMYLLFFKFFLSFRLLSRVICSIQ